MPTGNLVVQLADVAGKSMRGRVQIDLQRLQGEPGTGGESVEVSAAAVTDLTITRIPCRGGPGTLYKVSASTEHYRTYSFFQLVRENRDNTASDDVEFWVKPGDVTGIRAPAFDDLSRSVRRMLHNASMATAKAEDRDLVGASGATLYRRFGPLRKACLLNIATKLAHATTTGNCLSSIEGLLLCRQDRLFAKVKPTLPERLRRSRLFTSAKASDQN
jgi:hypothetical protein